MQPLIENPKKPTPYNNLTDRELFEIISKRETEPAAAHQAWSEFYKRYATYLWNSCLLLCKNCIEGVDLAKDIFQSTVTKIYLRAGKSDVKSVKAWISRIAKNEFHDYVKKNLLNFSQELTPQIEVVDDESLEEEDESIYNQILSLKFDQLTALLSRLTKREYTVLTTSLTYHQEGEKNHMPDDVIKGLCDEFNIEPGNIRIIKHRALLKLKRLAKDI